MIELEKLMKAVGNEYFEGVSIETQQPLNHCNNTKQPNSNTIAASLKTQPHSNTVTLIDA